MDHATLLFHAKIAIALVLLVTPIIFFASRAGFLSLENQSLLDKDLIPFRSVIGVFLSYFVFPLLLVPAVELIGFDIAAYFYDLKASDLRASETFIGWHRLFTIFAGVIGILWYMSVSGVQTNFIFHRSSPSSSSNFKAITTGLLTWIVAFPVVNAIGHLATILENVLVDNFVPQDQVAVSYLKSLKSTPILFWTTAVLFALIVPAFEEILFRGFLQSRFRCFLKPIPAILLTSLIFTLLHFSVDQGLSNIELLASLFTLSCFMGFLYEKRENLWASISLHATFNTLSIAMLMLSEG